MEQFYSLTTEELSAIDQQGFLHIPSFLSPTEVEHLNQDFEHAQSADNENYYVRIVSPNAVALVRHKLEYLAKKLREQTNTVVDQLDKFGLYFK